MERLESKKVVKKTKEGLRRSTYCVTGGNGYIGSWLVNYLLLKGYKVHATVRDTDKASHLLSMSMGCDRLKLFRADLHKESSFDEAIKGCDGVFHVAASMEFGVNVEEDIENYVQSNIIDPAINGTLNLLKSCLKSKSVKRVVFTSSISTITAQESNGQWKSLVDETCQNSTDYVRRTKASGWAYALSKLLTEESAFRFANENGIELVSIITSTVAGPFLTSHVPSSIQVLLSPLTGDTKYFSILSAVKERMGSIGLVHIEDICGAHLFLMEHHDKPQGKYICCAQNCSFSELLYHLSKECPSSNFERFLSEESKQSPPEISSKRLRDLGFTYKHGVEDIIHETVNACQGHGFINPI